MSNEQAVTELRAAKEVLYERGWHKGDLIGPDGTVCLLGACGIAAGVSEETLMGGGYTALGGLASTVALHNAAPLLSKLGPSASVYGVNDTAESFDEICDFIDATIKDLES